jgi:hypothetical protein
MFISRDVVLLQRAPDAEGWSRVKIDGKVSTTDALVCLPGYRAEVRLDSGVKVLFWGNIPDFMFWPRPPMNVLLQCRAVLNAPAPGIDADITLETGQLLLGTTKAGPTLVRLRFAGEVWDVTLADDQTEVVVDVLSGYTSDVPFSKQAGGEGPMIQSILAVLKGSAKLKVDERKPVDLEARNNVPMVVDWDNKGKGASEPKIARELPFFWNRNLVPPPQFKQRVTDARAALDDLSLRMSARDARPEAVLAEARAEGRSPMLRLVGVFSLGAVNGLPSLVDTLDDPRDPEMRFAAILTLRHWTALSPDNDLQLHKLLTTRRSFTELQADQVLQLLHENGIDLFNPVTYQALLGYLRNEKLAIRELAFWRLMSLDPEGGRLSRYNPAGDADARAASVATWEKRIPDGKLPPGIAPPSPPPKQ